ncbi:TPA: CAP domain-containing protein, partial [Candidatus Peregrinibacteria bacterium]|nr:CAP domain-containing protein [Candidatus Peregrinibacteria bacterium]
APTEKPYNDVEISDWFAGYFYEAQQKNIFTTKNTQNIYPAHTLTRGDLAQMMYKYSQFTNKSEYFDVLEISGNTSALPENIPEISQDSWDGVTLDQDILPLFRKGEIVTFSGKINAGSGNADTVSIIVTNSSGKSSKFSGDSRDGRFDIPVFFQEEGSVQIGILKGKSGSYITYEGQVFSSPTKNTEPLPENTSGEISHFSAKHELGRVRLDWTLKNPENSDRGNSVFHVQFRQNEVVKNIFVNTSAQKNPENSVLVPVSIFNNFSTGEIQIFIRGAKIGNSSLDLKSKFSAISKVKISAFERFTETVSDDIEITSASYEYNNTITVKGRTKKSSVAVGKGYVLTTGEDLFEKNLTLSEISGKNTQKFILNFTPRKRDFYVVEISEKDGRALAVLPIAPQGMFPVIPNEFDKKEETLTKISTLDALRRINQFRKKYNRGVLNSDAVISELALIRAEDMKKRNYFSHTTPAGKTVNDFRSDLGVTVPLSENIAIHHQSGLDATYSLEFSPTHRKNLLDENISRVGIGLEEKEDGEIILVQLFAGEKISELVLENLQGEISEKIQKKHKTPAFYTETSVLKKMTQQWANIMATQKTAKFKYDSGEDWDDLLKNYKIQRSSNVFIGSFPSQESLQNFITHEAEKFSEIYSPQKKTFALSLAVSDEGILFLCMVGEE